MTWEIFAYWNMDQLQGAFNAIAALTASNDFTGLLRLLALVAIISLVLAVLSGRARHEDFWRWVIMLAVVNGMMLVPKVTVVLVDRTSSQPSRVVANVPIGLATLAHGASKIGDWLTRAYETVFALPNDLQFQKNGLMFGHRILTESVKLTPEIVNASWARDFQEFWRECVMPDFASGYLSLDALRQAHDFWGMLNDTNPALYVTLSTVGTVSCPNAYTDLTNRLNGVVVPAMIQLMADQQYPGVPANTAQMRNAISSAYAYGLGVANTAESIVKQQMSINMAISAYCGTFAQLGDSNRAALCYSSSAGAYQTNYTYQVLAKIAESSMPKLKSAIEMIQYAVFPIIVAFAIVAGHLGLGVIRAYVMSLVWVQLWPPLYAVIHYIQTSSLPRYANMLAGLGDTMQGQPDLLQLGVSDQAIAGMLVVAIPPIAAALVKGGEVGLQAVAGLVSAPKTAERQAADNAKGNEATGQWHASPTVDYATSPQPVMRLRLPDGSTLVANADGTQRMIGGTSVDQGLPFSLSSAGKESTAFTKASETMIRAAQTETDRAVESRAAAFETLFERARQQAAGTRAGDMQFSQEERRFMEASREVQSVVDTYADKHQLTQSQRAALAAYAEAKLAVNAGPAGKIAKFLGIDFEIGAGARIEGMSAEEQARVREHAQQLAKETSFQKAIENLRAAGRRAESGSFSESGRRQVEALRSSESRMQTAEHAAAASLERAQALRELAQRSESGEKIIQQDFTTLALDRLEREGATIDGHTYRPGELTRAEALRIYTQGNAAQRADLMRALDAATRQEIEQYVLTQAQAMPTASDIEARHQASRPQVDIPGAAAANRREVETRMPAPGQVRPRHVEVPAGQTAPTPQQAGQMEVFRQRMEQAAEDPKKWTDLAGGAMKTAWNAGPSPMKAWKGEPDIPAIGRSEFPGGFDHGVKHQPSQTQPMPVQSQPAMGLGQPEGRAEAQPVQQPVTPVQAPVQSQPAMGLGQPEGRGGDNPLTATPGGSNLGKVFGGGQRTVVIQQAPEQAGQESKKDDMPPPRR